MVEYRKFFVSLMYSTHALTMLSVTANRLKN